MFLARAFPNPQVGGEGGFSPDFVLKGLDARLGVGAGAPGWESFQELSTISKAGFCHGVESMPEGSSSSGAQVGSEASGGEQEGTFQKGVPVTLLSHC